MKDGFIMLSISIFVAAVTWLVAGAALAALIVGIVTFLFTLLGGFRHTSDAHVDDTYGRDGNHNYDEGKSDFGGLCISGSWT